MPMACVSGDDGARIEDIKASHCSASSLYQCIKQNACQSHHSHGVETPEQQRLVLQDDEFPEAQSRR